MLNRIPSLSILQLRERQSPKHVFSRRSPILARLRGGIKGRVTQSEMTLKRLVNVFWKVVLADE